MFERKPILEYAAPEKPRRWRVGVLVLGAIILSAVLAADILGIDKRSLGVLVLLVWGVVLLFWVVEKMSRWQRPRL